MALVDYPDSESDEDDKQDNSIPSAPESSLNATLKRKHSEADQDDLPPLPGAFHDLYSTNARVSTSDNPSLHGGRKRAIPHVQGNWPSHVYLEWIPSQPEADDLHKLIQHVRDTLELQNKAHLKKLSIPNIVPSLQSELGAPLPLHISLSRTLHVPTGDRNDFLETLNSSLKRARVPSFRFRFCSLKWVPNFERNRWFLVLGIEKPVQDELNRLLQACNEAARKCGHSELYVGGHGDGPVESEAISSGVEGKEDGRDAAKETDRSDRFHVSIAWNIEEPDPEHVSRIRAFDVTEFIGPPVASFDMVKARIGNVVHSIDLGKSARAVGVSKRSEPDSV